MRRKFWSGIVASLGLAFCLVALEARGQVSFLVQPVGQWNENSCQSYALAIALAKARGDSFANMTARDLHNLEKEIRSAVLKVQSDEAKISHVDIAMALEKYTGDAFTLKTTTESYVVDEAALTARAATVTGVTREVPSPFMLDAVVKDVLLTSVTSIKGQGRWKGHIVAILGVDGPPSSSQRVLIANSGGNSTSPPARNTCERHLPDEPSAYRGHVAWVPVSDIKFRVFSDGKMAALRVTRK